MRSGSLGQYVVLRSAEFCHNYNQMIVRALLYHLSVFCVLKIFLLDVATRECPYRKGPVQLWCTAVLCKSVNLQVPSSRAVIRAQTLRSRATQKYIGIIIHNKSGIAVHISKEFNCFKNSQVPSVKSPQEEEKKVIDHNLYFLLREHTQTNVRNL